MMFTGLLSLNAENSFWKRTPENQAWRKGLKKLRRKMRRIEAAHLRFRPPRRVS